MIILIIILFSDVISEEVQSLACEAEYNLHWGHKFRFPGSQDLKMLQYSNPQYFSGRAYIKKDMQVAFLKEKKASGI